MSNVFVSPALVSSTVTAFRNAVKLEGKAQGAKYAAVQKVIDSIKVAQGRTATAEFLKGNAATNEPRKQVKALFDALSEKGLILQGTAAKYQSNFWLAYTDNVPFSTDLVNQKSAAKKGANVGKGAKADAAKKTKAGAVEKTDRAAVAQTLTKAHEQIQILIKAGDKGLTTMGASIEAIIKQLG